MSKLKCVCGWVLSDVASSEGMGMIYSMEEWLDYDFRKGRHIWECPRCGSIAIDEFLDKNTVIWYHPANKKLNSMAGDQMGWDFKNEVEHDGIVPIDNW